MRIMYTRNGAAAHGGSLFLPKPMALRRPLPMQKVFKWMCILAALVVALLLPAATQAVSAPGGPSEQAAAPAPRVFTGSVTQWVPAPPFMRFRPTEYGPGADASYRRGYTATLLQDGRVLVAGGYNDSNDTWLSSAILYVPGPGLPGWVPTGSMHYARADHTATLLPDGTVRVDEDRSILRSEIYDPMSGTWSLADEVAGSASDAPLLATAASIAASDTGAREASSQSLGLCSSYDDPLRIGCILDSFQPYASVTLANGTELGFSYTGYTADTAAFYNEEDKAWRRAGYMLSSRTAA